MGANDLVVSAHRESGRPTVPATATCRLARRALLAAALGLAAGPAAPARAERKARRDGDPDALALEHLLDLPEDGRRVICLPYGVCFRT